MVVGETLKNGTGKGKAKGSLAEFAFMARFPTHLPQQRNVEFIYVFFCVNFTRAAACSHSSLFPFSSASVRLWLIN